MSSRKIPYRGVHFAETDKIVIKMVVQKWFPRKIEEIYLNGDSLKGKVT
jgi:hypothetical protein